MGAASVHRAKRKIGLLAGCSHRLADDHPRLTPNVVLRDVTFPSAALGRDMRYRVILLTVVAADRKLPVVYLLHGSGEGFQYWSNYSDVARFSERNLVLVMPQGDDSYYVNRYEDYIVQDLFSDAESRFPIAKGRANRAIAGVSMGGFGAIKLALSHPDLFAFAGAFSAAIDVPRRKFSVRRIQQYRAHGAIFGPWGSDTRRRNDPFILARFADPTKTPYLFLECGESEGLLRANRDFARVLKERHLHYEFHEVPGGHTWTQWNQNLTTLFESLRQHSR